MAKDLSLELATALGLKRKDILGYKWYATGYSVITKDYRKFVDVQPADLSKSSPPGGAGDDGGSGDPGGAGDEGDHPHPGGDQPITQYPPDIPEKLKPIYDDPRHFTLQKVRNLAYFLEIPGASALRKPPLLDEIDAWKENFEKENINAPTN